MTRVEPSSAGAVARSALYAYIPTIGIFSSFAHLISHLAPSAFAVFLLMSAITLAALDLRTTVGLPLLIPWLFNGHVDELEG